MRFWDLMQRWIIKRLAVGRVVGDFLTLGLDDMMLMVCMGQRLQAGICA